MAALRRPGMLIRSPMRAQTTLDVQSALKTMGNAVKRQRRCSGDSGISAQSSSDQSCIDVEGSSSPAISVCSMSPPATPSPEQLAKRRLLNSCQPIVNSALSLGWRDASISRESSDSGVGSSATASPAGGSACATPPPALQPNRTDTVVAARAISAKVVSALQCGWLCCAHQGDNDDDTFDHVMTEHVRPMDPNAQLVGRRRPPRGSYDCRWVGCRKFGNFKSRGTDKDKFGWLVEHVTHYHSGRARPFVCLISGCERRFSTRAAQLQHVSQCTHTLKSAAAAARGTEKTKRRRNNQHYVAFVKPIDVTLDFLDDKVVDILAFRLLNGLRPVMRDHASCADVVGARKRKCRQASVT